MSKKTAEGKSDGPQFIYGRKNVNWQGPQQASQNANLAGNRQDASQEFVTSTSLGEEGKFKFPRTPHISGSNATDDDIFANFSKELIQTGQFIATEKMDGSNITINKHGAYSRNGETPSADWFYPARDLYYQIGHLIDDDITIAGELLTWRKSIAYDNLPSQFMVFSVIEGNKVLSWDDVVEYAQLLDLEVVNTLAYGSYDEVIKKSKQHVQQQGNKMEGFVLRDQVAFEVTDYAEHVAKWVGEWHNPVAGNNGKNTFKN